MTEERVERVLGFCKKMDLYNDKADEYHPEYRRQSSGITMEPMREGDKRSGDSKTLVLIQHTFNTFMSP